MRRNVGQILSTGYNQHDQKRAIYQESGFRPKGDTYEYNIRIQPPTRFA